VIARTLAVCLVLAIAEYAVGFVGQARWILPGVVVVLGFPLVIASGKGYWLAAPDFPGRAACRVLRSGIQLCRTPGGSPQLIGWSRLTRIEVFERADGRQTLIVLVVDGGAPPAPPRSLVLPMPERRIWSTVSPWTLDVGKLDHSAEEIIAAFTAHADVPVEHHLMPAASDEHP
jgi:hypothetical protein